MQAVSFRDGVPIDPNTGQPLQLPKDVSDALHKATEEQKVLDAGTPKIEDVVNKKEETSVPPRTEKPISPPPEQPKPKYTKYQVRPDSIFLVEFGLVIQEDRWIIIKRDDVSFTKGAEYHWVKFRMWSYPEELEWKGKSTDFDNAKRIHALNNDKLNDFKLKNLLKEWSFGEYDQNMKLLHVSGILSDEGLGVFFSLYPTVIRFIIDRMNDVLEYNG